MSGWARTRRWWASGLMSGIHPLQTSELRLTRLGERPHSSDGEATWNDHHGRRADVGGDKLYVPAHPSLPKTPSRVAMGGKGV
jgi:hypothetical protein